MLTFRWNLLFLLAGLVKADYIMQQVIKAFTESHSVKCHILLYTYSDEFYEQRVLLDFYKAVMKNNYKPTILENIGNENRENNATSTRKDCNRPLRSFIRGRVSYIAKYMIAEKKREDIKKDTWLLFVANDFDQELILSQIELSIRSEVYLARRKNDGYEFWEIYRAAKNNPISINYYGDWSADEGLKVTQLPILERRRDFGGAVLRSARFESDKYNNIQNKRHVQLLLQVAKILQKELNFTTERVTVDVNASDYQPPENPQNVIIRMLARKQADVSMIGLLLESTSLNIIDYSRPVAQTHYRIYVKKTSVGFESGLNFLHPLPHSAWCNVVLTVVVLPVIILFMYYIGRKAGLLRVQTSFLDLCIAVHQMLCLQGGVLQRELYSISLVFLFFNLWAFLIRTMYSASLASSLAIEQYTPPFNSLEELLENGQYEFGVHRFSSARDLYYKSDNLFIKKLNKAIMVQNVSDLPKTYLEGIQRVCSRKNYAFMASRRKVMELESEIPCKLHYLPYEVYTVSTAYAMSKHNEYLPFINRWLHVLYQVGLMDKIQHDVFGSDPLPLDDSQSFRSLTFEDTTFLQIVLIVGIVFSVLILFVEIVYNGMRRNRRVSYRC